MSAVKGSISAGWRARMSKCAAATALAIAVTAIALPFGAAQAGDLIQSQLLRLPRPVVDVIVGNPSIADVTVQGSNLVVVTGKTFGVTNIIALDADHAIIQDQRVVVQRDEERTVNLVKAGSRQSYSCTPNCSPQLVIGDAAAYFEENSKQASAKTRFSESSNGQGAAGQDSQ
jgi:Flp pilus assembly secretin CpaC